MTASDDDRKNFRRKKINHKEEEKKKTSNSYDDFSYTKIKNQFKKRKEFLKEQDLLDEMEDYS
jgi:hypothetical protein